MYNTKHNTKQLWIVSFDIGYKNFSFHIEAFSTESLYVFMKTLPPSTEADYNKDGTPSQRTASILNHLYSTGKTVLHLNEVVSDIFHPTNTCHDLTDILDKYIFWWDRCSFFVIEKQMNFKRAKNPKALKLGQHCQSYFMLRYGRSRHIIEFPAFHKTIVLGCKKIRSKKGVCKYKTIDKPSRKIWSIGKAKYILRLRGEHTSEILTTTKKLDDLSDTLLQNIAFIYKVFVDKSF